MCLSKVLYDNMMIKNFRLFTICILTMFSQYCAAGRYVFGETRICLNGEWMFKADYNDTGEKFRWFSSSLDDSQWDRMSVPGSWELTNEYSGYIGKAWYRTHFQSPQISRGQKVFLEFEAVSMSYKVFVNGTQVADEEVGNYIERFDVTRLLRPDAQNVVAVQVDNSLLWGAYCNWGGIRRPVNLCVIAPVHVLRQEITTNPDLYNGTSAIRVKAIIENLSDDAGIVALRSIISRNGRQVISSTKGGIRIGAHDTAEVCFNYNLNSRQTELWDIDHPRLYVSDLSLSQKSRTLNKYSDRFGIRKLELDGYQFKLNGKSLRLAGFNWVADDRTSGNTLPAWRYKEDIDRMKMLGANMARLSHRTLPEEVMDYLDEVGFLTVSEFNNWECYINPKSPQPRDFARKLVQQQYNHPCVVGWSVGNEMGSQLEHPQVNEYVKSIIDYIKTDLDTTHYVLYVSNTADFQPDDAAKYCDFIMINKYWNHVKGIDKLRQLYPGKPVFISEYGDHHVNLIYDTPNHTKWSSMMLDSVLNREHVFGMSLWTYNDYRSVYQSPSALTTTPLSQNRQWGVVDCYRNKKRCYDQIRTFFSPIKNLALTAEKDGKTEITILPRAVYDIPSFELDDYRLVWEVRSRAGRTLQGGIIDLPDIHPGDKQLNYMIRWKNSADVAYVKVVLMNPAGYNVADKRLDIAPPTVPEFQLLEGSRTVRAVFEKNDFSREYYLKYTVGGTTKKTASTIDHYIDLSGMAVGTPADIRLVAVNDAGETESPVKTFIPRKGNNNLPPIIWQVQPCNHGFYVGQGFAYSDLYYVIRYTQTPNDDKSWCYSQNRNLGMCKVSGLENGKKYYFQIASAPQGAGKISSSIWSEMKEVVPSATDVAIGEPVLHGIVTNGRDAAFICTPVKDGSLYELKYRLDGRSKEYLISRGDFDDVIVKNIGKGKITDAQLIRIVK
jgi:beta-galactosidase